MYRLVEYYRSGGPITYPVRYSDAGAAIERAELILRELAGKPRCPYQILVIDPVTGEIVHRVRPYLDTEYDPDPFARGQTDGRQSPPNPAGAAGGHNPTGVADPSQKSENATPGGPAR